MFYDFSNCDYVPVGIATDTVVTNCPKRTEQLSHKTNGLNRTSGHKVCPLTVKKRSEGTWALVKSKHCSKAKKVKSQSLSKNIHATNCTNRFAILSEQNNIDDNVCLFKMNLVLGSKPIQIAQPNISV